MIYRPEIDGLRAFAVLPVIFFHAGFEIFSGGFIGVDIFFVISGYLITLLLINDMQDNSFSILNFYERRARRLLPALFLVMLACIPFAWLWMLPDALENFGQSLVANSFFANNILLYLTSGYWDLHSEFKPLLHTWSLAVEEQFYLFFPIFLVCVWSLGIRKILWIIILLSILSLLLSEWGWRNDPEANFYLAPTRAWELFIGSITAIFVKNHGIKKNDFLSITGFLAIFLSIFLFNEDTSFPSLYTLIPVMGTSFIILFSGKGSILAKFLSLKLFVGMGLISYSAYLWHQPFFAYSKIFSTTEVGILVKLLIILFVIIISFFSWKYVEKPFRNRNEVSRSFIGFVVFFGISFFSIFGYFLHSSNGVPSRIFTETEFQRSNHEFKSYQASFFIDDLKIEQSSEVSLAIIGDSYAADISHIFILHRPDLKHILLKLDSKQGSSAESLCKDGLIGKLKSRGIRSIIVSYDDGYNISCISSIIKKIEFNNMQILFIGTKNFGSNLNWLARRSKNKRVQLCQRPSQKFLDIENIDLTNIPQKNYLSFMSLNGDISCIPITNSKGELISSDRYHLTYAGTEFFGPLFFKDRNLINILSD